MKLSLESYIRSTQPLIAVNTDEPDVIESVIDDIAASMDRAETVVGKYDYLSTEPITQYLDGALNTAEFNNSSRKAAGGQPKVHITLIRNLQFFIDAEHFIQWVHSNLGRMKGAAMVVIGISPGIKLPAELERVAVIHDAGLPGVEALSHFAAMLAREYSPQLTKMGKAPITQEHVDAVAKLGVGLTTREFQDALGQSLTTSHKFDLEVIAAIKEQLLRKSEILELHHPKDTETFAHLVGLDNLKRFVLKTIGDDARGVLLVGVPGAGKTFFSYCLGQATQRPVISLNLGRVFDSLVGKSEERMERALTRIDAFGNGIVVIDEIEKSLRGVGGGGDSGVSDNTMGIFLRWLSERANTGSYIVATCNDIKSILDKAPEYLRAGRWDALFFVDLPTEEERNGIWNVWLKHYGLADDHTETTLPNSEGWTGAEIETCCRLARLAGSTVDEMSIFICPTSVTASENIKNLQEWAKGRTVPASSSNTKTRIFNGSPTLILEEK